MDKELVFSITPKDFDVQTFRSTGNGGQNVNKRETAVRIVHRESGAVGQSQDERSQDQNKRKAFERLAKSEKFKKWHRIESAKRMGMLNDIDDNVKRLMDEKNLKIEMLDDKGKWVKYIENNTKEENL